MATTTKTYRLPTETFDLIDELSDRLAVPKSELLRTSVELLRDILVVAEADANGVLAVIRERHPDSENLTIDVWMGRDGLPQARALIDSQEHPDVGARAVAVGRMAFAFLTIPDGTASFAAGIGDEALLLSPRFAAGAGVPWPSKETSRIVLSLQAAAQPVSTPVKSEA